jgi:hypothetical protein
MSELKYQFLAPEQLHKLTEHFIKNKLNTNCTFCGESADGKQDLSIESLGNMEREIYRQVIAITCMTCGNIRTLDNRAVGI